MKCAGQLAARTQVADVVVGEIEPLQLHKVFQPFDQLDLLCDGPDIPAPHNSVSRNGW